MRCPLVLLLFLLLSGVLATLRSTGHPRLLGLPPPLRDRMPRPPRLLDWGADDAEAERVGQEALMGVFGGVVGGWERLVSGVGLAVSGAAERVRERVEEAREAVEGVAQGVRETVDGVAHDAGEVFESVAVAANPSIFPGTNWCGVGDRASRYNDTGVFKLADRCCRDHDSCPESIGAGESKYGVKNDGLYTMSLCKCDQEFYRCLKESNSIVAKNIGFMFFNVLKIKCFIYDYPLTCRKESLSNLCEEYDARMTASKIWQSLDNPLF